MVTLGKDGRTASSVVSECVWDPHEASTVTEETPAESPASIVKNARSSFLSGPSATVIVEAPRTERLPVVVALRATDVAAARVVKTFTGMMNESPGAAARGNVGSTTTSRAI